MADLSMPTSAGDTTRTYPSELPAAIIVARRTLDTFSTIDYGDSAAASSAHGALTESLRILLRALDISGIQAAAEADTVRRSVDAQFPAVAAFLAAPSRRAPHLTPEVLRLRMQMRAARYNPDLPHEVQALETVAGIWPGLLADVIAGRAPLDHRIPRQTLDRVLSVAATGPMPRTAVTA